MTTNATLQRFLRLAMSVRRCSNDRYSTFTHNVLSWLLANVWLVALAVTCSSVALGQQSLEAQQLKKVSKFVGQWTPESLSPEGITRLQIHSDASTMFIETWSACQPAECYWGERSIDISDAEDGVLSVTWAAPGRIATQRISLVSDGRLRVAWHTTYADSHPPQDHAQEFVRLDSSAVIKTASNVPESARRALSSVAVFFAKQPGGQLAPVGFGFLLQPGLIATSYNVVKNTFQFQVRVLGQSELSPVSEVLKIDEAHDLALVKIEGFRAWPLSPADSAEILVNDQVFVISNASDGTISAATVSRVGIINGIFRIEITTPFSLVESGAPVFNKYGQVVGMADSNPEGTERPGLVIHARYVTALMSNLARAHEPATTVDSRPVMLNRTYPQYTEEARRRKVSGQVTLRVLVGSDGEVKEAEVIKGLPYGLSEQAVLALRKTRFKPAMKDGRPVDYWLNGVVVEFNVR